MAHLARLRWWHIPHIVAMENEIFGADAWTAPMLWSELACGFRYRIAVSDGNIVGYAGLAMYEGGEEAWVNNIAVSPEVRRGGVGRLLLEDMLRTARADGREAVLLEVATDNLPAQKLYAAYGFEGVGIRKNYYQATGQDAAVMRLDLEEAQ